MNATLNVVGPSKFGNDAQEDTDVRADRDIYKEFIGFYMETSAE